MSLQRLTVVVGTYLAPIEAVDAHRDEHAALVPQPAHERQVLII